MTTITIHPDAVGELLDERYELHRDLTIGRAQRLQARDDADHWRNRCANLECALAGAKIVLIFTAFVMGAGLLWLGCHAHNAHGWLTGWGAL